MAIQLDEIDVRLLKELELDADRPNVELARIVGLSPAATLNRVRRLKESGVIRKIAARLDAAAVVGHTEKAAAELAERIRGALIAEGRSDAARQLGEAWIPPSWHVFAYSSAKRA